MSPSVIATLAIVAIMAGCSRGSPEADRRTAATATTPPPSSALANVFPIEAFARLGDEPVPDALAAELQRVLDTSADGYGVTATLFTSRGSWSGATGFAAGDRAMRSDDQMSIASITKTLVAAQVMQLVEAGELGLDDLAADRLPPGLEFDTNGARIADVLSMRSGISEYFADEEELREVLLDDPWCSPATHGPRTRRTAVRSSCPRLRTNSPRRRASSSWSEPRILDVKRAARSVRQPVPLARSGNEEAGIGAVDADTPQRMLAALSVLGLREEDTVALW